MKRFKQKSVMGHRFDQVPKAQIQRSVFDRSHGYKTTFNAGDLIPILVDEMYPGDTFRCRLSSVARLATPLVPYMDNLWLDFFFFAVPNRLLWENWERFQGQQDNPEDSIDFTVPQVTIPGGGITEGSLGDYFGLPIGVAGIPVNALHFRAYNKIFNDWFRDQNLIDSSVVDIDDGPDTLSDYVIRKRCKRRDYFTSCLPWPVKSGDSVDLPLGDTAPVTGIGPSTQTYTYGPAGIYETDGSGTVMYDYYKKIDPDTTNWNVFIEEDPDNTGYPNIRADLSNATAASINSLREAFQLQRLLERDARSGTRYVEIIKSHFGVTSPDFRLQRSEYLGGGSSPINVTPIAQTSQTDTTEQGRLAAIGYHNQHGVGFTHSAVEHEVIIGLVCCRADLTYQRGIDRMWTRQTRYDYYMPVLANLGEQEVLSREIYCDGSEDDDLVFGYQERWAELRYKNSVITSTLRSNAAASLDVWHLSQDFGETRPVLNEAFIQENPPVERVVAVTSQDQLVMDCYFDYRCTRPLPVYSVPGLIDHF